MSIGKVIPAASMMPQIQSIKPAEFGKAGAGETSMSQFSDMLLGGVSKVNGTFKDYENIANKFASGETVNVHELIVKGEQADISLRLMSAIRTKVIDAYHEVMRMQV